MSAKNRAERGSSLRHIYRTLIQVVSTFHSVNTNIYLSIRFRGTSRPVLTTRACHVAGAWLHLALLHLHCKHTAHHSVCVSGPVNTRPITDSLMHIDSLSAWGDLAQVWFHLQQHKWGMWATLQRKWSLVNWLVSHTKCGHSKPDLNWACAASLAAQWQSHPADKTCLKTLNIPESTSGCLNGTERDVYSSVLFSHNTIHMNSPS
jgi:hypothetical protein